MKTHVACRWLVCLLLLGVVVMPAFAQSTVKAQIPFNFVVENQTLNAGEYTVAQMNDSLWSIRSADGRAHAFVTGNMYTADSSIQSKLVFHRYGDEYFLSEIWLGGGLGRQILRSKREAQLARQTNPTEVNMQLSKAR